ncbi:MAG: pirin family protein, partial [bacterium]
FRGTRGPAQTFTPVNLWDLRLRAGARVELPLVDGHTTALLVLSGVAQLDGSARAGAGELAIFEHSGEGISVHADADLKALVLSGEPIDEPVVGYGPFVMNTDEEIEQAIVDHQRGLLGRL